MALKKRLDQLLVEKGFFPNRSQAKRSIMAGEIYVNNRLVDKAGTQVDLEAQIEFRGENLPYVSRGGLKLERALEVFDLDPQGKEAMDIGASTGGFTDCLLQHGATKVYAIDVGYGQLAWKLRADERVVVLERTNFRYLSPEDLPVKVPLIVSDVSFISLRLIIPPALSFLSKEGDIIALIKPQFEAGPERIGKKGLVRDKRVHQEVIEEISFFLDEQGLFLKNLSYSPITGANSKNIEFLIHLQFKNERSNNFDLWTELIAQVVQEAHSILGGG